MDAAYLNAAVPEPFTVLGKQLRPFCLGHEILLQRFKNKFSIEYTGEPPSFHTEGDLEHLFIAVYVCSHPYAPDFQLNNFKLSLRAWLQAKWIGAAYFRQAFQLFKQYIAAHTAIPDFYAKDSEGDKTEIGTPTLQMVKVSLMGNLGLSETEALNTPFSLAFWNYLSWAEINGTIQIIDEAETARVEAARAFESQVDAMLAKMQADATEGAARC